MSEADAITLLRDAMWVTIKLSAPMLIIGMLVGLIISIIQTTTSIQEQTLTFVPKLGAIVLALILFAPWMIQTMIDYMKELFHLIGGM
ncbi:MAG: flagellar biosynthetic protein FliQ [Candidatus Hydrogenedentota bacterium]|nr:MAG: flagellar biosynthetic protein FliQ [Candidatus Hydrogenedentota bacterium]